MRTPQPEMPEVSVVIPCRNETAHIAVCLASVLAQESPESKFEVIVANSMSNDGTREILKKLETRKQKAESRNQSPQSEGHRPDVSGQRTPALRVIDNP